jgi:hypothetical protein
MSLPCLALLAMTSGAAAHPADLAAIGDEIARAWRRDGPAGRLRVKCVFHLRVEKDDEALADRYLPNATTPPEKGSRAKPRAAPQKKWIEDVATRGEMYRNDYEFFRSDGGAAPRGWKVEKFFNGKNSWRYDPVKRHAFQFEGADVTTRLTLGYYQDMIGFPGEPLGKDRTTAGRSGEPYRLDALIPSGRYTIDREETVDGVDCVVLARPSLDRLWLSKKHGWAIVRREWCWSPGSALKRQISGRNFQEVSPGVWIPLECDMAIYGHPNTRPGQRVGVLTAVVLEAGADVTGEWFEPHFPRGAVVDERATGNRYAYGMELEELDATVSRAGNFGPMFSSAQWWSRPVFWGLAMAVTLLAVAGGRYALIRKREALP